MTEIHVKNLPEGADEASLKEYFGQFGEVVNIDMKSTHGNRYSFIKFSDADSATSALGWDQHELLDTPMVVEKAGGRKKGAGGKGKGFNTWGDGRPFHDPDSRKIFIGNLDPATTEKDLEDHFSQFGEILTVDFKFKPTGECKGYSFVTFKEIDTAILALAGPNNLNDRDLVVDSCGPGGKPEKPDLRVVFAGGLPIDVTEEDLTSYFETFGAVESVDLKKNRDTGAPKGFAFITFVDDTTQAEVLAQEKHSIREKSIDVKLAQKGVGKWGSNNNSKGQGGGKGGKGGKGKGNQPDVMKMMMMMKMMNSMMNGGNGKGSGKGSNRWTPY